MGAPVEIEVTLPGGRRVDARVRGHLIHTDQPVEAGGADAAPSPFELFLASLGACAGIFVQGFCAARGIPTDGLRIVERAEYDGGALSNVSLELQVPETFPARYRDAVRTVMEQCSVKKAIAAQPRITTHVSASLR